jgi:hypothetical protein
MRKNIIIMKRTILTTLLLSAFTCTFAQNTWETFAESNFTVEYPSNWRIDRTSAYPSIVFLSPYESDFDSFAENFNIVEGYCNSGDTYDSYIEAVKIANSSILIDFAISKTETLDSDFGKCLHIIYEGQETQAVSSILRFDQYMWFLDDNKTIVITFTCRKNACDDYSEIFETIFNSFAIK